MENLRLTFLAFGFVAIVGVLIHGLWTIRKNTKSAAKTKLEPKEWHQSEDDSGSADDGFDDVGVGSVRVISGANLNSDESQPEANSHANQAFSSDAVGSSVGLNEAHDISLQADDPLIIAEPLNSGNISNANGISSEMAQELTSEQTEAIAADAEIDDSLSLDNTEMDFGQLAQEHEEEQPKLYGSVVTQPKPEFKAKNRAPDSAARPTQASGETSIPEPPPFLLKSEAATPAVNPEVNSPNQTHQRSPVDSQGRVEPDFKLHAEPLQNEADEKPIGLAAQARKLVSRKKKSVADKIRKEPALGSTTKANEEQMRIDFNHDEAQSQAAESAASVSSVENTSASNTNASDKTNTSTDEQATDVLVLNVRAPADREIPGAALLPMLLTLGFKFGEQDIFHRHVNTNGKGPVLFSLANLFKPGVFDIDNIENFSTRGLSLFMMLPIEGDAQQVFNMMHNAARKLAEEFGCQTLDGSRGVLTKQGLQKYSERIREFERKRINR
ncbi:cell division protein ZipA [Glaciecola sp. MH2013]|uniref:cell division protein ZipA n=1 Tax=Glaciecola sp. MH2013 TaxID=2785524 RepID=UPI00189D9DBB|nr:cell division protein ZipA [Glaciecola sp. MH2013]MBF7072652.1 cell division protein ZipA [Glaciecola sp. MH2013]